LGEAPKDVKRLEVLKPTDEPSMGDRYDAAIAKENRLEAAVRPATKVKAPEGEPDGEESGDSDEEELRPSKKQKGKGSTGKNGKGHTEEMHLTSKEAFELEDEVQEGIDWMDEDENSDEEDSE
jgi:hypothetical protein